MNVAFKEFQNAEVNHKQRDISWVSFSNRKMLDFYVLCSFDQLIVAMHVFW